MDRFCHVGVLVAVCVLLVVSSQAQPQQITFERITEADGLPGGGVTAILQDRAGFMWFGTWDGLARYDGYEFVRFYHDPRDPTSIGSGHLEWLYEDSKGLIWIGLYGGGLNRYDPARDVFTRFRHDPADPHSIAASDMVNYVHEDSRGFVWIGFGRHGLDRYDPTTGRFTHYRHDPNDASSLSNDEVRVIYEDRRGTLWVGTGYPLGSDSRTGGLNKYDPERDAFTRYQHDPENPNSLSHDGVQVVYEDSRGTLWVGTGGNGLHVYDREHDSFSRLTNASDDRGRPSPPRLRREPEAAYPGDSFIAFVHEDQDGMLWFGSHLQGVDLYDPTTGAQAHFEFDPDDPSSLGDNRVFRMVESHDGTLWLGTFGGLFKIDRGDRRFIHYRHDSNDPASVGPYLVADLYVDNEGTLWAGTNRGGLQSLNRDAGTFDSWPIDREGQLTTDYSVNEIFEDRSGTLWVGLLQPYGPEGTLWYVDGESGHVVPGEPAIPSAVGVIHEDDEDQLWIGTPDGLYRYDRSGDALEYFGHRQEKPMSGQVDRRAIRGGPGSTLWLGNEDGLARFDLKTHSRTIVVEDVGVMALQRDVSGTLWLATESHGLLSYDPETNARASHTTAGGLIHDSIGDMVMDDDGVLWLSTQRGLSRFDVELLTFHNYDVSSGLPKNDFSYSAAKGVNGELYFGGIGGFVAVYPDLMNSSAPRVAVTELTYAAREGGPGRSADTSLPIRSGEPMRLDHEQNNLTVDYVGLHFAQPSGIRYAYLLEGFETNWRNVGALRTATYANLSPGAYTFRVKAANADGIWSEEEASIAFVILPPWWLTGWAYGLYVVLLIASIVAADRIRRRRLIVKERGMAAMRESDLRAEALEAERRHAAVMLEKSRELEDLNAQLKANQEQLEAHNDRLLELDELKNRFFANISHEFRTPLTLILGPVRDALDRRRQISERELDVVHRSAKRLLRLINQLLDLSKVDGGGMTLKLQSGDLAAFVRGLTLSFTSRAERERITLSFHAEPARVSTDFDRDNMEKIVSNLLSNAFKFTPTGGKVALSIREGADSVEISVRDTGPGIPKEDLPRLFDRFYQVDASLTRRHEGSGIGLTLVKELVELHGGSVSVESQVGFGSTFVVSIPLTAAVQEQAPGMDVEVVEESEGSGPRDGDWRHDRAGQHDHAGKHHGAGQHDRAGKHDDARHHDDARQHDAYGRQHAADGLGRRPENVRRTPHRSTVLLVEDNADLREYVRGLLESDYEIVEAQDGKEGLEKALRVNPDLVIADVMMPRMDGFDLTRAVRSHESISHVPVMLLTAKSDLESRMEGLEEGADDYLPKPFDAEDLLSRVESLIKIRRLLRERFGGGVLFGPREIDVPSEDTVFLESVRNAVEARMGNTNFGVDQLADEVALSPRHLQRRLKELTDLTAAGYIRMMRLARAAQLLEQGAGQVSEVAYQVGFKDADHFAKIFKQAYNVVPSAYGEARR